MMLYCDGWEQYLDETSNSKFDDDSAKAARLDEMKWLYQERLYENVRALGEERRGYQSEVAIYI